MKRRFSLSAVLLLTVTFPQCSRQDDERLIRSVLDLQVEAWNRGDIRGYMEGYWNSDSTTFISGGAILRGHREVLERYTKNYGSPEAMGRLEFQELDVRLLTPSSAVVHGVWRLTRQNDSPWGRFTLLFERTPEGWRIVHDHTSTGTDP